MNKAELVKKIIAYLTDKTALHATAAKAAHAEATHEESKAEDQYDTRGLEAAYLAAGLARQVEEVVGAVRDFSRMTVCKFGPKDPIDVSALVEVKSGKDHSFYFIGPGAGGTEIVHEKKTVLVITPQSPLGQQLVGKSKGATWKAKIGGVLSDYTIMAVH
jgi:transcription elongation GreA/GreB family factor